MNTTNLIKNWTIKKLYDGAVVIYGEIYNDERKRFADGTSIHTSRIQSIDFVEGIVKTRNSVYHIDVKEN
jgi:hypothetical protein